MPRHLVNPIPGVRPKSKPHRSRVRPRLTPPRETNDKQGMFDLTRPWPRLLDRRYAVPALVGLVLLLFALSFVDEAVSRWAQALPAPVRAFFAYVTDYGLSDWILVPSLAFLVVCSLLAFLVPRLTPRVALRQMASLFGFIFLGVGLPGLASNLMKRAIGRGRPTVLDQVGTLDFRNLFNDFNYQSFPSGHTTTAFAFAFVVGFMSPRLFPWMFGFAVLIGLSRVVEGVHYPTDVLGGVVVGTLGAYAVRIFFASRDWTFRRTPTGIAPRPLSSVVRLVRLSGIRLPR